MNVRWTHVFLALVLVAPISLCVGCECKSDSDCGQQTVTNFVGGKLVGTNVQLSCHDKHCEP
jgi:hypothetical protein